MKKLFEVFLVAMLVLFVLSFIGFFLKIALGIVGIGVGLIGSLLGFVFSKGFLLVLSTVLITYLVLERGRRRDHFPTH
jgi:hypothetical protein